MKTTIILILGLFSFSIATAFELTASVLSPEKAPERERNFSPQVRVAEEQKQFDKLTAKGLLPVYSERVDGKIRAIYIPKPPGCTFWTFNGMDEVTFLKRHKKHKREGFVLASSVVVESEVGIEYWATWVNESSEREIKKEMRKLGVSQAIIKE